MPLEVRTYVKRAKRTLERERAEKGNCPSGGPHRCHLPSNHRGHCACEHGLVWLSPIEYERQLRVLRKEATSK